MQDQSRRECTECSPGQPRPPPRTVRVCENSADTYLGSQLHPSQGIAHSASTSDGVHDLTILGHRKILDVVYLRCVPSLLRAREEHRIRVVAFDASTAVVPIHAVSETCASKPCRLAALPVLFG